MIWLCIAGVSLVVAVFVVGVGRFRPRAESDGLVEARAETGQIISAPMVTDLTIDELDSAYYELGNLNIATDNLLTDLDNLSFQLDCARGDD